MASYIEIVGVQGLGKTTMYRYLRMKFRKNVNWILYEDLCKNKYRYKSGIGDFIRWHIQRLRNPGLIPKIPHNRNVLLRFIENNPELLEFFWKVIEEKTSNKEKDLRFYKINYIREIMEKIQNVEDENTSRFCLIDEGLIHNLNYFTSRSTTVEIEEQIVKTLDLIPLPVAVIYFDCDDETLIARTRSHIMPRGKFHIEKELTESPMEAIREKEKIVNAVRLKGVPVLSLDARLPLERKFEKIEVFIRQFSKNLPQPLT